MATIDDLAADVDRELGPQFEERLRATLGDKSREWLVDELVRIALEARSHRLGHDPEPPAGAEADRAARADRIRGLNLDAGAVRHFADRHSEVERDHLVAEGHLKPDAPRKGTAALGPEHRSEAGNALLQHAGDILFALLFGDEATSTRLDRVQRELLTLAVPRSKADVLDFMRASTELSAEGTWHDPENVSDDEQADNVLIEVEFGETADEIVGRAIVAALGLINNLAINEQVLYARMVNVEESTLID